MPKSRTCPTGSRKVCIKKGIKVPKEMKVQRKTRKARKTKKVIKPVVKTEKKATLFSNIFGSNEEEKPTEVVEAPVEVEETPSEVLETPSIVCLTPEELETMITEYKSASSKFSAEKEAAIREKMVSFCMNDKYKKLEFYPKIGIFNSAREEREELIAQAKTVIDNYLKYSSWSL
jgi:hypothetical protein